MPFCISRAYKYRRFLFLIKNNSTWCGFGRCVCMRAHARYVFKQSTLGTTPHTHTQTLLNSTPANVKLLLGCPRICLRGAGKVSLYADFLFYFQLFMPSSPSSSRLIHTLHCSFERAPFCTLESAAHQLARKNTAWRPS